jgi:hypothetical protein
MSTHDWFVLLVYGTFPWTVVLGLIAFVVWITYQDHKTRRLR